MKRFVIAGAACLWTTAVVAQVPNTTLEVLPGALAMVTVPAPYTALTLGNVEIADALPKSDTVVIIQGKKPGYTDLLILKNDKIIQKIGISVGSPPAARTTGRVFIHSPGGQRGATNFQAPQ